MKDEGWGYGGAAGKGFPDGEGDGSYDSGDGYDDGTGSSCIGDDDWEKYSTLKQVPPLITEIRRANAK